MPVLLETVEKGLKNLRDPKKYQIYPVTKVVVTPAKGVKTVTYKGKVKGATDIYDVMMQFHNVDFVESLGSDTRKVEFRGKTYYFKNPKEKVNPVKMKCFCQDFRFMFEKQLYDEKGLIGSWKKYKRKTPPPPVGRDFKNPDDHLGMCKHLWSFLKKLEKQKRLK